MQRCLDDSEVKEKLASDVVNFLWSFVYRSTTRCLEIQIITQFDQERGGSLVRTNTFIQCKV